MKSYPDVIVNNNSVLFNGKEIEWPIAAYGVTVKIGGPYYPSKLVVEFVVGNIEITGK